MTSYLAHLAYIFRVDRPNFNGFTAAFEVSQQQPQNTLWVNRSAKVGDKTSLIVATYKQARLLDTLLCLLFNWIEICRRSRYLTQLSKF